MDRQQHDRKEARTGNSVLTQLAVKCKNEAECYYQTLVQVASEVLRNANCGNTQNVMLGQHANLKLYCKKLTLTKNTL
jgi:hypothetical protein